MYYAKWLENKYFMFIKIFVILWQVFVMVANFEVRIKESMRKIYVNEGFVIKTWFCFIFVLHS